MRYWLHKDDYDNNIYKSRNLNSEYKFKQIDYGELWITSTFENLKQTLEEHPNVNIFELDKLDLLFYEIKE